MGSLGAIAELAKEPIYSQDVEYLVRWAQLLYGRSGLGFGAAAPLSHQEIEAWCRLMQVGPLHPLEVEALTTLDGAMHSGTETSKEDGGTLPQVPNHVKHAWPKRKEQ